MINNCIETHGVTKIYNPGKNNEVISVKDISLSVGEGQVAILKGPSGSGKTTLLSMIGCLVKPTSGEIVVQGKSIAKLPEKFANLYKRDHIGFVFQHFNLLPSLSAVDNIMLPLYPMGISLKRRKQKAAKLLKEFNLESRQQFAVKNLSGGEQQRVSIARALINGSRILLADEPTAHLDSQLKEDFLNIIKGLKEKSYTILMTSHDDSIMGDPIVDKIFEMKEGEILA